MQVLVNVLTLNASALHLMTAMIVPLYDIAHVYIAMELQNFNVLSVHLEKL